MPINESKFLSSNISSLKKKKVQMPSIIEVISRKPKLAGKPPVFSTFSGLQSSDHQRWSTVGVFAGRASNEWLDVGDQEVLACRPNELAWN
jgi:hypothetical protein